MSFCPEHGASLTPIPGSGMVTPEAHHSAPTQFAPDQKARAAAVQDPGLPLAATVSPATPLPRSDVSARPLTETSAHLTNESDPWIGQEMGNFRLIRLLGMGGMGAVYLAEHNRLPKKAAVKLLKREFAALPEVSVRFDQEARAAAEIGNDHVVQIYDFGQRQDGTAYLVMEFLEGKSLAGFLKQAGAIPPARVYEILRSICLGLGAAHERKIIHRDLKPDNIFLSMQPSPDGSPREVVKILDFGIAKVNSGLSKANGPQTGTGMILGTPYYMSPEQAEGGQVDIRSDIYSLGVILYEMLIGRVPFSADTFGKILLKHIGEEPVSLRQARPDISIPSAVDKVVLRCLEKDPAKRPQNTKELMSLFEAAVPYTNSNIGFQAPPKKSRLGLMVGGGLAAVAALVIGAFSLGSSQQGNNNLNSAPNNPPLEGAPSSPIIGGPASAPVVPTKMSNVVALPSAAVYRPNESQPIGQTPFVVSLPVAGESMVLILRAEGFQEKTVTLTNSDPDELRVELAPLVALDSGGKERLPKGNKTDPKGSKTDPKVEPKVDPPKTDPPKIDPLKVEPKVDPPKTDPPKTDPPKTDPKPIEKIQDGQLVNPFGKKPK